MNTRELALLIAKWAGEKRAKDVVILDMQDISLVTDYFVVASGNSTTQVQAIADHIEETCEKRGFKLRHREGYRAARWILLDYGDVVVHIFREKDRKFYSLERLWGDAKFLQLESV